jgi:hypothetical protein
LCNLAAQGALPAQGSVSGTVGDYLLQAVQEPLPVIEQRLRRGFMLGTDKSRDYCVEMICADFLAGGEPGPAFSGSCPGSFCLREPERMTRIRSPADISSSDCGLAMRLTAKTPIVPRTGRRLGMPRPQVAAPLAKPHLSLVAEGR